MATKKKSSKSLVIVAGDSGVYVGLLVGGAASVTDATVRLTSARHLRRYYVADHKGDGSAGDLAVRGIDLTASSVSDIVPGVTTLMGVRRVCDVADGASASFGIV